MESAVEKFLAEVEGCGFEVVWVGNIVTISKRFPPNDTAAFDLACSEGETLIDLVPATKVKGKAKTIWGSAARQHSSEATAADSLATGEYRINVSNVKKEAQKELKKRCNLA